MFHSWGGGVSFIKRTCSYFDHSTPVFETLRYNCQLSSFTSFTQTKAREITLFKDELFEHEFQDNKNIATDRYVFLSVLSVTRSVVFLSKSFKLLVSKTFWKNLSIYDFAKCIAITNIVTILPQSVELLIAMITSDYNILVQVFYQDQNIVQLIGDMICPHKKCRGEKCVNLTMFEGINKSPNQCKQCKACSHMLKTPFKDRKPCVTLFCCTYCFRKKTKLNYQKEKLSLLMQQCVSQSKLFTTKAEEANNEPAP